LANDDCIGLIRGAQYSVQNKDYGQCKHLKERVGDPWWIEKYRGFAFKQMAMAERELGWFFWTWKTGTSLRLVTLFCCGSRINFPFFLFFFVFSFESFFSFIFIFFSSCISLSRTRS
jgi:hypothetical protein